MNTLQKLTAGVAAFALTASVAFADDKATVQKFYDLLSDPGSEELTQAFSASITDDWESMGDYSGKNKTSEEFLGQMAGFAGLVPDIEWAVEDMYQDGDTIIVRSRATGTPVAPFFGVDGEGRSFDIMTIDIHEMEDGLIARSYHVEDWAGALQQLSGK